MNKIGNLRCREAKKIEFELKWLEMSWKMKVLKEGCVRKLAVKRDRFYKRIAGGPRLLVTQICLEKCQSQESSVWNTSSPNHGH